MLSGNYQGTIAMINDPAGHAPFIGQMPGTLEALQVRNTQTGVISIYLRGPAPWVEVSGVLQQSEAPFVAKGTGTVAGFPGVEVSFSGSLTQANGLSGDLVVGSNGKLPQGAAATYRVQMTKQG